MKHILILILTLGLILFVLVPAAFIFLGKVNNPLQITPIQGMTPQYRNGTTPNTQANTGISLTNLWTGNNTAPKAVVCDTPQDRFEAQVKDATLGRNGEDSIVESKKYKYKIVFPLPVYDWNYTNDVLPNESASFVYEDTIINILARTANIECGPASNEEYKVFHTQNGGIAFFSSRAYVDQSAALGLSKAILKLYGTKEVNDRDYYWYQVEENYWSAPGATIVTRWYSTRVGRTEYWFVFRVDSSRGNDIEDISEEILESIEFDSLF